MDWDSLKSYATGFIVRWLLKAGAGVLLTLGLEESDVTKLLAAVVSFGLGALISIIQHKQALAQQPPQTPPAQPK